MDTRSANLQVRFTKSEMDQIKKLADEHGRSRSEFARERILAEPPLSGYFHDLIEGFSGIGQPYGWILERIIADYFARRTAYQSVWEIPMKLFEFAQHRDASGKSELEGEKFVRWLEDVHTKDMVRARIEGLMQQEQIYFPLPPHDEAFMIEHRAGRSWAAHNAVKSKISRPPGHPLYRAPDESEPKVKFTDTRDDPGIESEPAKYEGEDSDTPSD